MRHLYAAKDGASVCTIMSSDSGVTEMQGLWCCRDSAAVDSKHDKPRAWSSASTGLVVLKP